MHTKTKTNKNSLQPDDVFYDLGSGVGNVCAQVFLNSNVGRVKGVEFVPSRHTIAVQIERELRARYPHRFDGIWVSMCVHAPNVSLFRLS